MHALSHNFSLEDGRRARICSPSAANAVDALILLDEVAKAATSLLLGPPLLQAILSLYKVPGFRV